MVKLGRTEPVLVPKSVTLQAVFRRKWNNKAEASVRFNHYRELYTVSKLVY